MILELVTEPRLKVSTHLSHVLEKRLFFDSPLNRQRRCTRDRMTLVCLPMPELSSPLVYSLHNRVMDQDTRNRGVSAPESFSDCLDIRDDALLLPCVQGSTTAHTTHNLVEDK